MNNLEYFKDQLHDNNLHNLAHCVAETGKCFIDIFDIRQDQYPVCKRQGVSNAMDRYFICRKCLKDWLNR
jgi:hypothetical protein